jgi:lipoprotein-releasing system permease protein
MNLAFEGFVAVRYLLARRKQAFISLISAISILGVTVGVMALLIALALMTGLQGELRDRIVGASAQIYVSKTGAGLVDYRAEVAKLGAIPHVVGAAPAVLGKGLLTTSSDSQAFATIKGIEPGLEPTVTDIRKAMRSGSLDAVRTRPDTLFGIVLGTDLADSLGVKVGDTVRLITPDQVITPFAVTNRIISFKVVGVFSLGLFEFDSEYALVDLPVAEHIFGKTRPDFIQLRLNDMFSAPSVAEAIPERLGSDYLAQDWADMNKSLFSALWLEKMAISITIGLIVMVAALNIIASLVLLVMEKSRDIAILRTMGAPARAIRRIFIYQGLTIGLLGTGGGAVLGLLVCYFANKYRLISLPADIYQISYLPFRVLPVDVVVVVVAAIAVCLLATLYPSRQAGRLDPAEALRNQ